MARILVADDVEDIVEVLEKGLIRAQFTVVTANDGLTALAKALDQSMPIDLAILDWRMPGLDGVTVLKRIREQGLTYPVVLLTANVSSTERAEGLRFGANEYITKPFLIPDVIRLIRQLVLP